MNEPSSTTISTAPINKGRTQAELDYLTELQAQANRQTAATANRQEAMKRTNEQRDAPKHAAVDEALDFIVMHGKTLKAIAQEVEKYLKPEGMLGKFKLEAMPGDDFIKQKIKDRKAGKKSQG